MANVYPADKDIAQIVNRNAMTIKRIISFRAIRRIVSSTGIVCRSRSNLCIESDTFDNRMPYKLHYSTS